MRKLFITSAAALLMAACSLPFGIGRPSTSQLENGAADNLANAKSFEVKGTFTASQTHYTFDTKYVRPSTEDTQISEGSVSYEVMQIGGKVYVKGSAYLTNALTSADAKQIINAVGDRWFTTSTAQPVDLSPITDANKVKSNFLTTISDKRNDDVSVDGQNTAELTLSDAILNITESTPYRLVRLRSAGGKSVNGVGDFDMKFSNWDQEFGLQTPTNVFDLDDPTTWPPYYQQVGNPNNSACNDPCVLSQVMQNAGGLNGASAPSTVTFTLKAQDQTTVLGSCKVTIQPDHPHGQQFTVSCSIQSAAWTNYAGNYYYLDQVDNPSYD